jgi:hypothetical protein
MSYLVPCFRFRVFGWNTFLSFIFQWIMIFDRLAMLPKRPENNRPRLCLMAVRYVE